MESVPTESESLALGRCLQKLKQHRPAIQQFRLAIECNPACAEAYNRIGLSERALGDTDAALRSFATALELEPESVESLINLGDTRFLRSEFAEAMALYRSAASLPPRQAFSLADIERQAAAIRVPGNAKASIAVHTLLRAKHVTMYLYCIDSFARQSDLSVAFHVYNDGTLTADDIALLRRQVEGIEVIEPGACIGLDALDSLPYSKRFVRDHVLAKKLFGIGAYAITNERIILLDADVLFFKPPTEIIDWASGRITDTLFNADRHVDSTPLTDVELESLSLRKIPHFNSGLVCMESALFDLALVESVLTMLYSRPTRSDRWLWEQTVWAALVSQSQCRALPPSYSFVNNPASLTARIEIERVISRHYSRPKPLFFAEGVDYLLQSGACHA